jgi:hypothetical protein
MNPPATSAHEPLNPSLPNPTEPPPTAAPKPPNTKKSKRNKNTPTRKPRSDSPLRCLPWDRQVQIVKALESATFDSVLADLQATDHITVQKPALSKFRLWHLDRVEAVASRIADDISRLQLVQNVVDHPIPEPDMRKFQEHAVRLAWARAYENEDTPTLMALTRARLRERRLDLEERCVALKEYEKELECLKFEDEVATAANRTRIFCQALPEICSLFAKADDPHRQVSDEEIEREVRKIWNIKPKPNPDPAATPETPPPSTSGEPPQPSPSAPATAESGSAPAAVSPPASEPDPSAPNLPHPASPIADLASPTLAESPAAPSEQLNTENLNLKTSPPKPVWEPTWATAGYTARGAGKIETPPPPGLTIADLRSEMTWNKRFLVITERGLELYAKDFNPVVLHRRPLTPEIVWWAIQDLRNGRFAV